MSNPEPASPNLLPRDEYVEQAHLYGLLRQRGQESMPIQELLDELRHEILITTKLPMAMDYLLTEVKHSGLLAPAMYKLRHYFTDFQTYLIRESEADTGRFMMSTALQILEADAKYRLDSVTPEGMFFFQFEALCRNRLSYDRGLAAMSNDPLYNDEWTKWILNLRAQVGLVDFADLIFLASEEYKRRMIEAGQSIEDKGPFLFGDKEGRIAFANRRKDPLFLFSAVQRHLGYPKVPRPIPADETSEIIPQLLRRVERVEARLKILDDERRGGMDITRFYEKNKDKPNFKLPELPE
ncbi:hypothetical protein [Stieleria marina]|uniref:Uncharacterized protein n=1 Tax=Stieleria marina TaxID=1930275 RepID=A0A517NPS2_9BACT|nr:hypothetical protein K239x_10550 [Planctomycetes bacterium K23_9]